MHRDTEMRKSEGDGGKKGKETGEKGEGTREGWRERGEHFMLREIIYHEVQFRNNLQKGKS